MKGGCAARRGAARLRPEFVCAAVVCAAFICAALTGCASAPSADEPGDAVALTPRPTAQPSVYEQQQRDRALGFARQKRLADAALAWELLTVLRPDLAEYRERLADVQRQIDAAVAERAPRAAQAAQRGELDNATQLYLSILALQPLNEGAADALRALERERNKRSYLGKFSRTTLTRRAMAEAEMPAGVGVISGGLAGRNDIEHASLLAGDGEFDDAIGLLERRLVLDPKDGAARRLLADVYYRQAESLLLRDRPGAVVALQKSARAYPAEPRAANRLRQLESAAAMPAAGAASAPTGGARPTR